jgi:hypothetical protein
LIVEGRGAGAGFMAHPLHSNYRGLHTETQRLAGFMKYAAEMGSVAMMYIPTFIKTGA